MRFLPAPPCYLEGVIPTPLTRIYCADPGLKKEGRQVALPMGECLKCAATRNNPCHFTHEILSAMYGKEATMGAGARGDGISTTRILSKCVRSTVLEAKVPYALYPQEMWAGFRGTMAHAVLEGNMAPGDWGEVRCIAEVPGLRNQFISCMPDLVSPAAGILWDYKTTTNDSMPKYGDPWPDHEMQLQVNRWIIDNARWEGQGRPVDNGEDGYLPNPEWQLFDHPRPEVWEELRIVYLTDKTTATYAVTKSIDVPKVSGVGTKKARVADIWSDEQVLDFLVPRYEELRHWLSVFPEEVPPVPDDLAARGRRGFPCDWCPVKGECDRLLIEEGR